MRLQFSRGLGTAPLTPSQAQVAQLISSASAQYNVPDLSTVALGVATHESALTPTAQNPGSSAAGVFQLVSATQTTMGVSNPYDAQQNVNAGVSLLAQYYNTYGNWPQALQAFSDGPGTVAQGLPPSSQTLGLISYVQSNYGVDLSGAGDTGTGAYADTSVDTSGMDTSGIDLSALTGDSGSGSTIDWMTVGIIGAVAAAAVILS